MPLFDYNSFLLPGFRDAAANGNVSLQIMELLFEKHGVTHYHLMPLFDCTEDTVSSFLLKRHQAISKLQKTDRFSKLVNLHFGATAELHPGLWQTDELEKLCYGSAQMLSLRFPLGPYQDWMDQELNHLLYHGGYSLLFTSFELPLLFFERDTIERLLRIQGAVFHFNYRSLLQPQVQETVKKLLAKHTPVLFGTNLSSMEKTCYYEMDHYLNTARGFLTPYEYQYLWEQNHVFWKNS